MSAERSIRILLADDHPIVREGLASIIARRSDMQVIAEAASGREAVALYRKHRPDVVLMDLRMPDMDGMEAITAIRSDHPNARIVVLTTYDGDEFIFQCLRAGARAFLLKDAPRDQLMEVIHTVHAGQSHLSATVAAKLATRMHSPELTARETDVLRLMVAGHTNQEIGNSLFITEATVKSHVNSILNKMHVSDRTQAVTQAVRRGMVLLE